MILSLCDCFFNSLVLIKIYKDAGIYIYIYIYIYISSPIKQEL